MSYTATRQAIRDLVRIWRPNAVLIETKANGQALVDELRHEIPCVIGRSPDQHGNKVTRAHVATPRFEAGQVLLPESAPWIAEYIDELAAFPNGAHDDMVDDTSQYFLWIQERWAAGDESDYLSLIGALTRR
jgi:predicted phage terminase large subunit-like protein